MNCIIVDDDQLSRNLIEAYIERTQTLSLSGSFSNPIEALHFLQSENNSIDLLFLDILMPEMNGFQILDTLDGKQQIIVISGKKEFALDTFQYGVTDYLLKPITYERFFKAVDKAYERNREIYPQKNSDNFLVKIGTSFRKVNYNDILFIEADNENTYLVTDENKFKIISNLEELEVFLPEPAFLRVHANYLVNLNKVSSVEDEALTFLINGNTLNIPFECLAKKTIIGKIELSKVKV
ncbi:MAG TPA: LytTR family DNA-binding domain-containing protein [Bacteroidales bacterium]|nr:LytTR family DNA-binding domain-containing protein [Bacteroidales bacterium]HQP04337.1 LytTR family DNA-binding domain-containing protein [Bacteroidales bacterium]